jgi:hypothetical protein
MNGFCLSLLCYHCSDAILATGWMPMAKVAYSPLPQCLFVVVENVVGALLIHWIWSSLWWNNCSHVEYMKWLIIVPHILWAPELPVVSPYGGNISLLLITFLVVLWLILPLNASLLSHPLDWDWTYRGAVDVAHRCIFIPQRSHPVCRAMEEATMPRRASALPHPSSPLPVILFLSSLPTMLFCGPIPFAPGVFR